MTKGDFIKMGEGGFCSNCENADIQIVISADSIPLSV